MLMRYLVVLVALLLTTGVFAQNRIKRPDQDKIKAYKIAYITEKLDLTSKEAEKFWPIYNEISDEIERFRKESRRDIIKQIRAAGGLESITDDKASDIVQKNLEMQKRLIRLEEGMVEKLQKFLPYKKILKLQVAEREF